MIQTPIFEIQKRPIREKNYLYYRSEGVTPIQASILASRLPDNVDPADLLKPDRVKIPDPYLMTDMTKATLRLADYLVNDNKRPIVFSTDFDVDGIAANTILCSVISGGLFDFNGNNKDLIIPIISNRMNDGYGFTDNVVDQILAMDVLPELVITADHGSSNCAQITRLVNESIKRNQPCDVIVSDHHIIPAEGGPKLAHAFINPNREGDTFPDKTICGATVAWLLLEATRMELVNRGVLDYKSSIDDTLDYAASATVADCVSLASPTNRYIINNGLEKINNASRPAWSVFLSEMGDPYTGVTSETIAFQLGPMINANSRVGMDGTFALNFMLAKTEEEASANLAILRTNNDERKGAEKVMVEKALKIASEQYYSGMRGLTIWLENGSHGIHGIVASRVVEKFGCPTMCVSPKTDTVVSASVRSIEGVNLKAGLDSIQKQHNVFIGYGGHYYAAGASFNKSDIDKVTQLFNQQVISVTSKQPKPIIKVDSYPNGIDIFNLDTVDEILSLQPFGREFDYPMFSHTGVIEEIRAIGADKTHARLEVRIDGKLLTGVWFKARQSSSDAFPVDSGDQATIVFSPKDNWFRGERSFQIQIKDVINENSRHH